MPIFDWKAKRLQETIRADEQSASGVYWIRNLVNNKVYAGSSTKSVVVRLSQHLNDLVANRHVNKHLQAAWNKYGAEQFEFRVLKTCTADRCTELEQEIIDSCMSFLPQYGYNICPVAGNTAGVVFSNETREKISNSKKGSKLSEATKKKMSLKRRGVPHSKAHQEAVNAALRSPEVRAKMRAGHQRRKERLRASQT